jgi:hypothetical protein
MKNNILRLGRQTPSPLRTRDIFKKINDSTLKLLNSNSNSYKKFKKLCIKDTSLTYIHKVKDASPKKITNKLTIAPINKMLKVPSISVFSNTSNSLSNKNIETLALVKNSPSIIINTLEPKVFIHLKKTEARENIKTYREKLKDPSPARVNKIPITDRTAYLKRYKYGRYNTETFKNQAIQVDEIYMTTDNT